MALVGTLMTLLVFMISQFWLRGRRMDVLESETTKMAEERRELLAKIGELGQAFEDFREEKESLKSKIRDEHKRRAAKENPKENRGTTVVDLARAQAQRHLQPIDINL
ncbi:hypothetical protein NDN08_007184 [Rhodosorus marinus]|uniref:Endoplasmic reticulum transmembrane protein n=1 Tax=Rhodosorus marinus TaxID=101924 RepID=A0AAV8UIR1_9RHOD|nr:hypothetical protein NDN08_007184 [Rhodosorus marinus]